MTLEEPLFSRCFRVAELPGQAGRAIRAEASADERAALAAAYDLADLAALTFEGEISSTDTAIWRLRGVVRAKATQTCVVTLSPIKTTIEETIDRLYADRPLAMEDEVDIDPEGDDPPDPLDETLDYGAAALEGFGLALDPYPRAPGAEFGVLSAAPPGAETITDAEMRPFAGLAALKKAMERDD